MRLRFASLAGPLLGLAAAASGCGTKTEIVDEPYQGEAFPERPRGWSLPEGPYALVSNNGSDTISVIDLAARRVVAEARVGLDPVDNDGPHHLAVDRASGRVYVALAYPAPSLLPGPHAAHGSSSRPGRVVRLSLGEMRIEGAERADDNPGDIALSDDGKRLVVTHFDLRRATQNAAKGLEAQRASLLVYDAPSFGEKASRGPKSVPLCVMPHGAVLSQPDGRFAFVACNGEDALAVVDLSADDPASSVKLVPVGPGPGAAGALRYGPYSATMVPGGKSVLVGNTESRDVRAYDVEKGAMSGLVYAAGGAAYFAAATASGDRAFVLVQTPDALARVELSGPVAAESARRAFSPDECALPHEAMLRDQGRELLLVCEGDHEKPGAVLVLDPETLETRASIPVGVYPDKIVVVE